jgi:predicted HicB family RNase H-like nuclease
VDDLRQDLRDLIHPHIEKYAAIIGVANSRREFEKDVTDALQWCVLNLAIPRKRLSEFRKDLLRVSKEARAAQRSMHRLRTALESLSPPFSETLEPLLDVQAKIALSITARQLPWFYALSSVADVAEFRASRLGGKDKGGAPKKLAFTMLVLYLARAFENATKRKAKVTWNAHKDRFQGDFISLVEGVLPLAKELAEGSGLPFPYPNSRRSRGKYVYELTRVRTGKLKSLNAPTSETPRSDS